MRPLETIAAGERRDHGVRLRLALALASALCPSGLTLADAGNAAPVPAVAAAAPAAEDDAPIWRVGAQLTSSGFLVPGFRSPYRNPEASFGASTPKAGWAMVTTLFAGVRPWQGAVVVAQPEFSDGAGAPNVSGIAGYIDGNIIRVAKVGTTPYVARLFLQQQVALPGGGADDGGDAEDDPEDAFMPAGATALGRPRPASRLEVTAGKFAATDFFDVATASSDPRHHFMNWSLMTNGAWDFAADTRGYTWGLEVALEQPRCALRAAAALMPTTPNGPTLDGDLARARSEMVEAEVRYAIDGSPGAVKALGYANHARMGAFADALAVAPAGQAPRIDAVARPGATKVGAGVLVDQRVGPAAVFLRASWNDGRTEEFAFTQIERAASAGAEVPGAPWGRALDRGGVGVAVNGLSPSHVRYLQAGGIDFQLGDGRLRYAPEAVVEAYYALHLARSLELTADLQAIANPGMNADRGPVLAAGLRAHAHL
jgi:hypothetical protein